MHFHNRFIIFLLFIFSSSIFAQITESKKEIIKKWVFQEFHPSTLSKIEQINEMNWFFEASKPYKGMLIRIASERIKTHQYESSVLAKAFFEITGIQIHLRRDHK